MEKLSEEKESTRLLFIDNLRSLLTFIVVMHHTMITYGASGGWYFVDPDAEFSIVLSFVASLDQAFFMGLFFLLSAYFTQTSYNRHGPRKYLKNRLLRFGIPLLIYIILIEPLMVFLLYVRPDGIYNFFQYYTTYFTSWEGFFSYISSTGPLWFIFMLLLFAICYSIYRQITKNHPEREIEKKAPKNLALIIIGLTMATLNFLMRIPFNGLEGVSVLNIQLAFVMQYIVMLILGIISYRRDWLRKITKKQAFIWLYIIGASLLLYGIVLIFSGALEGDISKLLGGFYWESFAYSIWEAFFCLGVSICLIYLFRERLNSQNKVTKLISDNSYAVYLIHAPTLVAISVLFSFVSMPSILKFPIVLILTLGFGFLLSHFALRRIPGAKRVLG